MSDKRRSSIAELDTLLSVPAPLPKEGPDISTDDTKSDPTLSQQKEEVQSEGSSGTGPVATVKETVEQQVVVPTQKVLRNTGSFLEGVSIPGGIALPLGILLLFTLALFPVNGHTRLAWLWMAITGQASIGGPLPAPLPGTGVGQSIIGGISSGSFGSDSGTTNASTSTGTGGGPLPTVSYTSLIGDE